MHSSSVAVDDDKSSCSLRPSTVNSIITRVALKVIRGNSKSGVGANEGSELMLGWNDTDGAIEGELLGTALGLSVGMRLGAGLGRSDGD
jgi:hypothetical protein